MGYFGDDNDAFRQRQNETQAKAMYKVQTEVKLSNAEGQVLFQNVAIGKYAIEIEGTDEYLPTSKQINLINDEEQDQITIFVGIKPRIDSDYEFRFVNE